MWSSQTVSCEECEECQHERRLSKESQISELSNLSDVSEVSEDSEPKRKTYVVTKGQKKGHPWSNYNRSSESIYVNGVNGPTLHLHYGTRYYFRFDHPGFILTTSPMGGANAKSIKGEFETISKNSFEFQATEETPKYFFYQDEEYNFQGGIVHLQ